MAVPQYTQKWTTRGWVALHARHLGIARARSPADATTEAELDGIRLAETARWNCARSAAVMTDAGAELLKSPRVREAYLGD